MYPFTSPNILTDAIFVDYGGSLLDSTPAQRNAAYFIAERWVSDQIGTLAVQATVTGTFYYPQHGNSLVLDYAYVSEIKEIRFLDAKGTNYFTITGTANYNAAIRNAERGILDVFAILGYCKACGNTYAPYQFEIPYTAGLPTGTYTAPNFLLALTSASKIALDEIIGWGGETFSGITEFRNQQYSEKRLKPVMTAFGASPKAQFIKTLLDDIIRLTVVGL